MCHLWNLVADGTREGDVYRKLLDKLEQARESLGGQVFDVLGKLQFEGRPRCGNSWWRPSATGNNRRFAPASNTAMDNTLERGKLQALLEEGALAQDAMDARRVHRIREDMERAEAQRLQPHYVESFFRQGVSRAGRHRPAARVAALRDHPRAGTGAK